jgi:hypothetical protein
LAGRNGSSRRRNFVLAYSEFVTSRFFFARLSWFGLLLLAGFSFGTTLGLLCCSFLSPIDSLVLFFLSFSFDSSLGFFVVEIADGVLELEEAIISYLESSLFLSTVLHWAKVDSLQRSDGVFRELSIHVDIDRNGLVDLLSSSFQDVQNHVSVLSGCLQFDFSLGKESDDNGLLSTRLELIFFRLDLEDLSGELLLPLEIVFDWVLAIILDSDLVLLGFTNSN